VEAVFAGPVGERRHAPVVQVAAAVEHYQLHACRLRSLGDQRTDLRPPLATVERAERRILPRRRGQGAPGAVVDDLRLDALVGAVHDQPGTVGRARDLVAEAHVAPLAQLLGCSLAHGGALLRGVRSRGYCARLPTLRRMCSPWYLMPL